jgi:hypothetical protein
VYTSYPADMRKLDRMTVEYSDMYSVRQRDEYSADYVIRDKRVKLPKPISEATSQASRDKASKFGFKAKLTVN